MVRNNRMETQSALAFTLAHHSKHDGESLAAGLMLIGSSQPAINSNRAAMGVGNLSRVLGATQSFRNCVLRT